MFIDDYSYLENNPGDENMNMRPMPYMTWGNSPMYNPYMPNMASSMDNINYNDMNRCNNNIANKNEDYMYTDAASPVVTNEPQSAPAPAPAQHLALMLNLCLLYKMISYIIKAF